MQTLNVLQLIRHGRTIRLGNDNHCHCLCLQETHSAKDRAKPRLPGMALVAKRPHNKHGISVFVRDDLKVNSISVCEEDNVEFIIVELPGVVRACLIGFPDARDNHVEVPGYRHLSR